MGLGISTQDVESAFGEIYVPLFSEPSQLVFSEWFHAYVEGERARLGALNILDPSKLAVWIAIDSSQIRLDVEYGSAVCQVQGTYRKYPAGNL